MSRTSASSSSSRSIDLFDEKEQLSIVNTDGDEESLQFDAVIGVLEELLVDPDFTALQTGFLTQHAHHFEPSSTTTTPSTTPNTLHHTHLHNTYTRTIESFLLARLHAALPGLDLPSLGGLLVRGRCGEEWSDVLDVLSGLSEYMVFKELMMDKRAEMDEEEESRRQASAGKQVVRSKRQELNDFGLHITSLKQVQAKRGR